MQSPTEYSGVQGRSCPMVAQAFGGTGQDTCWVLDQRQPHLTLGRRLAAEDKGSQHPAPWQMRPGSWWMPDVSPRFEWRECGTLVVRPFSRHNKTPPTITVSDSAKAPGPNKKEPTKPQQLANRTRAGRIARKSWADTDAWGIMAAWHHLPGSWFGSAEVQARRVAAYKPTAVPREPTDAHAYARRNNYRLPMLDYTRRAMATTYRPTTASFAISSASHEGTAGGFSHPSK